MRKYELNQFKDGWFIGNFDPSIARSSKFEICVKEFTLGEREFAHYQKTATEITLILKGQVRMGNNLLSENDILVIEPMEICDFEAISDCKVLGIKFPSLPNDKVLA